MSGGEALGDVPGGRDQAPFLQGRREGDSVPGGARKQITGVASSRWAIVVNQEGARDSWLDSLIWRLGKKKV